MSAFWVTCPTCGARYLSGCVGKTLWPPHECPATGGLGAPDVAANYAWLRKDEVVIPDKDVPGLMDRAFGPVRDDDT